MENLQDEVVFNCCAHLSILDGGLGLFRLLHLVDAVCKLPHAPRRITSIGSGSGYHEIVLARLLGSTEVTAVDLSHQIPRYPQANLRAMQLNILEPEAAQAIAPADFVYSIECLEHIKEDQAAYAAMCRLLRPGGYFYIEVPFANESERMDPYLREHEWKNFEHHTPGYDRLQLARFARDNALSIVSDGNAFWSPLQPMIWAGTEKFSEDQMRLWLRPLIELLRSDVRDELATSRNQATGIKMLCRK
ncbi:MAG: class I SAM-dependent methyltransferase [Rubrivivax sp.]